MNDEFVTLVMKMRAAQKEFFETKTRSAMKVAVKLETQVDQYLERYISEKVQLEFWSRSMRTDEEPGAYNVTHEETADGGGGA